MSTLKFKQDLERGKNAENVVCNLFGQYYDILPIEGYHPAYDIACYHYGTFKKRFTIEVKNDIYAASSGNMAIEVFNCRQNKPSGVLATKADLWCHVMQDEIWMVNATTLLSHILKHRPKRIIGSAGDGNAVIWLYGVKVLTKIFTRIDNLDADDFKRVIDDSIRN